MRQAYRLVAIWLLVGSVAAAGKEPASAPPDKRLPKVDKETTPPEKRSVPKADKEPVPSNSVLEPIRNRVKTLFKAEFASSDLAATAALAAKLVDRAADEKENPAIRYVMLTEAITLATKSGEIEFASRAARQIDENFDDPDVKEMLTTSFMENFGGKDRLEDIRALVDGELSRPLSANDQAKLGQKWLEVAMAIRTETRVPVFRRARALLCEAMSMPELNGLARTEAEKTCQEATKEIDKADAKNSKFTLYEGKWVVKYENKYTHEYVIRTNGSLAFDCCISPDGTRFVKAEEQKANLVRQGGVVVVSFAGGKVIERFSIEGDKLLVDRFFPATNFPNKTPDNKGEGVKEK
jgi:hypothetical protein